MHNWNVFEGFFMQRLQAFLYSRGKQQKRKRCDSTHIFFTTFFAWKRAHYCSISQLSGQGIPSKYMDGGSKNIYWGSWWWMKTKCFVSKKKNNLRSPRKIPPASRFLFSLIFSMSLLTCFLGLTCKIWHWLVLLLVWAFLELWGPLLHSVCWLVGNEVFVSTQQKGHMTGPAFTIITIIILLCMRHW